MLNTLEQTTSDDAEQCREKTAEHRPIPSSRSDRRRLQRAARKREGVKQDGLFREWKRNELLEQISRGGFRGKLAEIQLEADDSRRRAKEQRLNEAVADGFQRELTSLSGRGWKGRGGGRQPLIPRMREYRATSVQVAGLWPWAVGSRAPLVGTPIGTHLRSGEPVGFDPLSWFKAGMISAPIAFLIALNGFGKSSFVRRMVIGAMWQGQIPLVLGDCKPDYRDLIEQCGGQIIDLGYGYGVLNPLEVGALGQIIPQLPADHPEDPRGRILNEVEARQVAAVSGLIEIVRGRSVEDFEESVITVALKTLYQPTDQDGRGFTPENPPILADLKDVVDKGSDALYKAVAVAEEQDYQVATRRLRQSLEALITGPFGKVFNGPTTTRIDVNATAVCVDVSRIPQGDAKLKAAVLAMTWAAGFGAVEAANTLADFGMGPQREYLAVLDELWQVLGAADSMVDRINELTRLQRQLAVGMVMITHSIDDLSSLATEAAVKKARGFIQRARVKIIGAIPDAEVEALRGTVNLTATEAAMVTSWSSTAGDDGKHARHRVGNTLRARKKNPFGLGKFLIKDSDDATPGIGVQHTLTPADHESGVHNTNARFDMVAS